MKMTAFNQDFNLAMDSRKSQYDQNFLSIGLTQETPPDMSFQQSS